MKTELVKARVNAIGKDLTGDVVQMAAGTIHIIMSSEREYFVDRPTQFELLGAAEMITWVFNTSGVVVGLRLPDGTAKLLTEFGGGGGSADLTELENAIAAMQAQIAAIQSVNGTQTNSITALQTSVAGFTATLNGLQTQATANANAIATISNAISALNLDQVAETASKKHFTTTIKAAIEGLMTTLAAGIPVVNGQIRYPGVVSVSDASQNEGAALVHNVVCLNKTGAVFAYSLIDLTTNSADFNHTPTLSNGVTLVGSVMTVPAGVEAFTVTYAVNDDATFEANETYSLSIGGVTATGTIVNNDGGTSRNVETVSSPTVTEGGLLVYTVGLSGVTTQEETYGLVLSGTANVDDRSTITFNNGVTSPDNNCVVPIGVASFTISIQTVQDTFIEGNETLIVTVGGVSGTGTINNDDVVVTSVYTLANVPEGSPVVFFVELNGVATAPKTFTFARSGTAVPGVDFVNSPVFTNGVTLSGDQLTLPVGVLDFTVTYDTINDTVDEMDKTILLVIGTANGTAVIVSDDGLLAPFSNNLFEVPYYLLSSGQRSGLGATDGYAVALVERNAGGAASTGFSLRKSVDNSTYTTIGDASYVPTAMLLSPVGKTDTVFELSSGVDLSLIDLDDPVIAFVGNEAIEITAYDNVDQEFTVRRGVLDTVPEAHAIGSKILVVTGTAGYDPTEYVDGNIMYYKALSKNASSTIAIENVMAKSITFDSRASRPYPPNLFQVNSQYYPASVLAGDITISWQNRNRVTQITDLIDYNDAASGGTPETVYFTNRTTITTPYTDVADAVIKEYSPTSNDNGGSIYVGFYERVVIRFGDLSNPIFNGRTVTNATLRFDTDDVTTPFSLKLARLLKDFVETEVTWQRFSVATDAETDGLTGATDIDLATVQTFTDASLGSGEVIITGANFVAQVQAMIDGNNYGFLMGDFGGGAGGFNGLSSDTVFTDFTPVLTVEFAGGGVEPEAGQTHTVQFYNDTELLREVTGITTDSYVYTDAQLLEDGDPDLLTVKLFSVRDGLPSWTAHEHTFTRPFTGVPLPTAINISGGMEGGNAVFTVTMSGPYTDQVDHGFTLTGDYDPEDIGTITFNNDVEDNGNGTLLVPAGVSTFTMTIPILTDALSESGENIILTMGSISNIIALSDPT